MPLPQLLLLLPLLLTSGAEEGLPSVQIDLKDPVVKLGTSLNINCSSLCPYANESLGLETSLQKQRLNKQELPGNYWMVFYVTPERSGSVHCWANCNGTQTSSTRNITVYAPPEHVELMPPPAWVPVGKNYTLDCQVLGVMPLENLTVTLFQGTQELGHQDFLGKPPDTQIATATFTFTARREDHGANVSCQAELDLRRLGLNPFYRHSASVQLRTFQFKSLHWFNSTVLNDSWLLEAGTAKSVSCEAEVFPAGEAQFHLSLGGQKLNLTVTGNGDRLKAEATVWAEEGPERELDLNCTVAVGDESRTVHKNLIIYNFPPPELILSEQNPVEKTPVNVSCRAQPGASVKLEGHPEKLPGEPVQLIAREEDDGRILSCEATLSLGSEQLVKHQNVQLHVLYGPRMNASDCPGNWTWLEGTEQVLHCRARGNPPPTVQCVHAGIKDTFLPETPLRVTRAHTGTYRCTASSQLGTVARDVIVKVDFHELNVTLITVLVLMFAAVTAGLGVAGYLYYRQQRIRRYELKKAQEQAALRSSTLQGLRP
ncbi:intercellular adhesion molecule 1 [Tachyglossus aculeatus]|uniref:intercellular adhesion molecule 1 n=1 Tax=Tachyglossus aculeatus TaxID=9261 RepID=UPI0018F4F024|nr:intercellular adhesion molecule 1 [Tachyglossus aculeatus]